MQDNLNGEGNDHPAILRRPVRPAYQIGDVPNDVAVLFESVVKASRLSTAF